MTFTMTVTMDNAAFGDGMAATELRRILEQAARDTMDHDANKGASYACRDVNGNRVGEWRIR